MDFRRLKLKKLNNARDLGGIQTADGRKIKQNKLIRSGKLYKLPEKTVQSLQKMGITTVVDLRIENERCNRPDTEWEGCRNVRNPILCAPASEITGEYDLFTANQKETARVKKEGERIIREFGSTDNYMIQSYRSMLFDESGKDGLRKFLRLVIDADGGILWHCASGKDRAGICAMLVEALLGVDKKTILADYMASKNFWRKKYFLNKTVLFLVPVSRSLKKILFGLMSIKEKYLQIVIDEVLERYGGIEQYCKAELGITDSDIAILKEKYLE